MRGDGFLYQGRTGVWYASYSIDGKRQRESLRTKDPDEAQSKFRRLLKGVISGRIPLLHQRRVTVNELLNDLERHAALHQLGSLKKIRSHLKSVRTFLGDELAASLQTAVVEEYQRTRLEQGRAPATINRACELLRQAYRMAYFSTPQKVPRLHHIPLLPVENARQGFLAFRDFEAILAEVDDQDVRDFLEWFGWTAMRPGEIRQLTWEMLDRDGWLLHLAPAATKGKKGKRRGRTIPVQGPLREIMERRLKARLVGCPLIFHRVSRTLGGRGPRLPGQPVRDIRLAWAAACKAAGFKAGRKVNGGLTPYDLRRSALRNIIRGGTHETVAMKISGHQTRSTFDRYNITSTEDVAAAFDRTADYVRRPQSKRTNPKK